MTTVSTIGRTRLRRAFAFAAALPLALFLSGHAVAANCNGNTNNKVQINQAGINTALEGSTVTLNVKFPPSNPTVAQGGIYTWNQVSGPAVTLSATSGTTTSFVVPHITTGSTGVIVIRANVTGATCTGATPDSDTISINVANLNNFPPVAVASASAASVAPGAGVTLSSAGSYDPDNDPIVYAWTQTAGPAVTLVGANTATASFVAPSVASTTTFTFQLKVTENLPSALFDTDAVSVNVTLANQPPVAAIACPANVDEGAALLLDASGSNDPENGALSYSFSQLSGFPLADIPAGPHAATLPLTAPALGLGETGLVEFGVTVTDAGGASDSASCSVFINDVTAPVLSGGGDQTLEATSPAGAMATYSVTSYDNVDGAGGATCVPPSGSDFPLGATPVACAQSDSSGNIGELGFTITVVDTTPPVIDAHGDVTEEATSPAGAIVTYSAPATSDAYDGAGVATCVPPSGSQFALGSTAVTCDATDSQGNAAASTGFNVLVQDTTAPEITAPADISVEATGPLTTVALVDATATDAVGPITISSDAPAQFPVGTTVVTWTATDGAMNSSNTTSHVTVTDTTPPSVDDNADQTLEATGPAGAFATFAAPTAHDLVDGDFASTCDYGPGVFPLGTTTVTCSATDAHGNTGSSSFDITVQDTTPPSIAAHADVTAFATSASGAVVNYSLPTATDLVDGSVAVTCLPASGSTFAIGSTTVECSATDSHGNTGHGSFSVIVSYNFAGFFKPIDNLPVVNVVKAGQGIPVKFSLGGNMGLSIFASGYPRSVQMVCNGAVSDAVEETVTAGGSSLSYDATTGQYIYVWKSEKAWAGTCRQLQVKLADGTYHYANFSFTR